MVLKNKRGSSVSLAVGRGALTPTNIEHHTICHGDIIIETNVGVRAPRPTMCEAHGILAESDNLQS